MSSVNRFLRPVFCAVAWSGCLAGTLNAAGSDLEESIRQTRMGTLVVQAAPGAEVRVEQLRHEFWFGAALASQVFGGRLDAEDTEQYKRVFLENFNAAVTENALQHALDRLAQFKLPVRVTAGDKEIIVSLKQAERNKAVSFLDP
jgi:hypothetical protein